MYSTLSDEQKKPVYHSFVSLPSTFGTSFCSLGNSPPYVPKVETRTHASPCFFASWALAGDALGQYKEMGTGWKEGGTAFQFWRHQWLQDWLYCLWQEQLLKIMFMAGLQTLLELPGYCVQGSCGKGIGDILSIVQSRLRHDLPKTSFKQVSPALPIFQWDHSPSFTGLFSYFFPLSVSPRVAWN